MSAAPSWTRSIWAGGGPKRYLIWAVTLPPVASSIILISVGQSFALMPSVGGAQLEMVSV